MSQNASLYYYHPHHRKRVRLRLVLRSFHCPRTLLLELNQEESQLIRVNNTLAEGRRTYVTGPFTLKRGDNSLKFHVKEGCVIAKEVETSGDRRCLSLVLDRIDIKTY